MTRSGHHALKTALVFGVAGGLLIVAMRFVEYRFLVVEHSIEIYGAIVAAAFAAAGIWLGLSVTKRKIVPVEGRIELPVPSGGPLTGAPSSDRRRS